MAAGVRRLFLLVALVICTSGLLHSASDLQVSLDAYSAEPARVVARAAASESLSSIVSSLRRDGPAWMLSHGAGDANRRRLIAATFALEVAATGLESSPKDVPVLIEWGCEQVRRRMPSDAERQWHIAALALLEGLGNLQAVEAHLAHASARLADEPMWDRARVWISDSRTLNVHPRQPLGAAHIAFPAALAAQYQVLAKSPSLAGDAWLRIGFFHFLAGAHDEARADFARTLAADSDSDTVYLAHLFTAWTFERDEQRDTSALSLQRALAAAPYGRTAALWLANARALSGAFDDAEAIAERGLRSDDAHADPWRVFYAGDVRRWPILIEALRRTVQ